MAVNALEQNVERSAIPALNVSRVEFDQGQAMRAVLLDFRSSPLSVAGVMNDTPDLDVVPDSQEVGALAGAEWYPWLNLVGDAVFIEPIVNEQFPRGLNDMPILGDAPSAKARLSQVNTSSPKLFGDGAGGNVIPRGNHGRTLAAVVGGAHIVQWDIAEGVMELAAGVARDGSGSRGWVAEIGAGWWATNGTGFFQVPGDGLHRDTVLVTDLFERHPFIDIEPGDFFAGSETALFTAPDGVSAGNGAIETGPMLDVVARCTEWLSTCGAHPLNPALALLPSTHDVNLHALIPSGYFSTTSVEA